MHKSDHQTCCKGIHIHLYLDDLLRDIWDTAHYIFSYGFLINLHKSQLKPAQVIMHLGVSDRLDPEKSISSTRHR